MEKTNMSSNAESREESSVSNFLSEETFKSAQKFLTSPDNSKAMGDGQIVETLLSSRYHSETMPLFVVEYRIHDLTKWFINCLVYKYNKRIVVFYTELGPQVFVKDQYKSTKYRDAFIPLEEFLTNSQVDVVNCCALCSLLLSIVKAHIAIKETLKPGWISTVDRWDWYGVITKW